MKTLKSEEGRETTTICRRARELTNGLPQVQPARESCQANDGERKPAAKVQQIYSRAPWARMMRIHQLIQDGSFPNCTSLAREFEVATKTVTRDIEFMRSRLELPIEYDGRRVGYFYAGPVTDFPNVSVTDAEMFSLLVANAALAQYQGTPFQPSMEAALRKLTGQLGDNGSVSNLVSFRPFAPEMIDEAMFGTLTGAIQERRVVEFLYRKVGGTETERRQVQPYHLSCIENHWYLIGFDAKRGAMRTFALPRLRDVQVSERGFTMPESFDATEYMRGSFSAFKGADDYEVVIEFDLWASDLVRGRQWHGSQSITELPGGMIRLRMRLDSIEEAQRWVMSWGTHAMVVRPAGLCNRVHEACVELAARYLKQLKDECGVTEQGDVGTNH